jgi:hypothetical protein
MNDSQVYKLRPLTDWQAVSVRLTTFLINSVSIGDATKWWQTVCGDEPDTRNESPKTGTIQLDGGFRGQQIVLSIVPGRADWNLVVPPSQEPGSVKLLEFLEVFVDPMAEWLEGMPGAMRLALGLVAFLPVLDRATGYRQLAPYVPSVQLDPETMQDFLFQVNRRRTSKVVPSLLVNRLSKWAVGHFGRPRISIQYPGGPLSVVPDGDQVATILDLDINSAPEHPGPIGSEVLPLLLKEFTSLAIELVERGDVA